MSKNIDPQFLESKGFEHYNVLPTPTKVEASLGIDENGPGDNRYWPNSYVSVVGMIFLSIIKHKTIYLVFFSPM